MKETNRKQKRVKGAEDRRIVEFFVKHGQFLLPKLPDRIAMKLTDVQGNTRLFKFGDKRYPGVFGRLDPYVVPLRVGSMYTLQLRLDQFWCQETQEFSIPLAPGNNLLTAQFDGTGAKPVNLDMAGIKLMNFWMGHVESNTLTLER